MLLWSNCASVWVRICSISGRPQLFPNLELHSQSQTRRTREDAVNISCQRDRKSTISKGHANREMVRRRVWSHGRPEVDDLMLQTVCRRVHETDIIIFNAHFTGQTAPVVFQGGREWVWAQESWHSGSMVKWTRLMCWITGNNHRKLHYKRPLMDSMGSLDAASHHSGVPGAHCRVLKSCFFGNLVHAVLHWASLPALCRAVPCRAVALEGIGSRWPHYFPLNQPKEGFSQAHWSSQQQGGAVTHLQQAGTLSIQHKNITYWHIF